MRLVRWVLLLIVTALFAVFAVSNREAVSVEFWPLPLKLDTRLFLVVLLFMLAGFFIGAFSAWVNGSRYRRLARERSRRIAALERDLAAAQATSQAPPRSTALVTASGDRR